MDMHALTEMARPRGQVVKGERGGAGNNAIEVIWEVLCALEALPATSGAAEII